MSDRRLSADEVLASIRNGADTRMRLAAALKVSRGRAHDVLAYLHHQGLVYRTVLRRMIASDGAVSEVYRYRAMDDPEVIRERVARIRSMREWAARSSIQERSAL